MLIRRCHIAFHLGPHRYFALKEVVECTSIDCFSPILAISRFCSESLSTIIPPLHDISKEEIQANETKCFKPMFEAWNIHLLNILTRLSSPTFRDRQNFYILVALEETNLQEIQSRKELFRESSLTTQGDQSKKLALSNIFKIDVQVHKKLKFGLYHPQAISQRQTYAPRPNKVAIFVGAFFNNQEWSVFNIEHGAVPTVEDLLAFDAILITGSSSSVLNKSTQVQKAIDVLGDAYQQSKSLKIVGVCYGHQLILQHFGAEVVKKQLFSRLQSIYFDREILKKYPSLTPLGKLESLTLSQYHEDFVEEVPNNFDLIGRSESCKVESAVSKDGRILTFQFHCELPYPYLKRISQQFESLGINLSFKLIYTNEEIHQHVSNSQLVMEAITDFLDL